MDQQNAKNHGRYIPLWHFVTPLIWLAVWIGSIVHLINTIDSSYTNHFVALLIFLIALILGIFYWYIRWFALRAQDRAIRAEENFRHYLLTGKPFDKLIRMNQVIALRFASDAEFPALAKRAVDEKLTGKQIKEAIQEWKADHNRV